MISIVICSRDQGMLNQVTENVKATIGVPYEICAIDNSRNRYGICEAYNLGASQSKYGVLCFMHEDIAYHTPDWGKNVVAALADQTIGLIGVVGGRVKTRTPAGWWIPEGYHQANIIQRFNDGRAPVKNYVNPKNETISDVVTVDGVWFCCRRDVWEQNPFDQVTFPEFHLYDQDFAMQILHKGYRVCVVYNVLLEHFSMGSVNLAWLRNVIRFSRKWKKQLPVAVETFDAEKWRRMENSSGKYLITVMLSINLKNATFFYYLFRYLFSHPKGWTLQRRIREKLRTTLPQMYQLLKTANGNAGRTP